MLFSLQLNNLLFFLALTELHYIINTLANIKMLLRKLWNEIGFRNTI